MKSTSQKRRKNSSKASVHRRHQKHKSKKRRRRDASISYSDSNTRSESSQSISSTDSGEDSRGRGTTRAQDGRKRTTKRVRRSPSSSSEDRRSARCHRRCNRGRSESKRIRGLNKRKKPIKRKHMNSRSPGSSSCPSCSKCGDSSSSTDSEIERSRRLDTGKFGSRGRSHHRERTQTKRYRSQSRSSSSCSVCSIRSYRWSRERSVKKSISRRLGSVVTVVKDLKEQDEDKDENNAEIIPAYDDCPSRSNDSNDGGRKRESATLLSNYSSQHASEKRGQTDEKVKSGNDGGGPKAAWDDPPLMEKNEVCGNVGSLENEDLESMLRRKALENFKRFRNGLANSKCTVDQKDEQGVSKQVTAKVESIQSGHAKAAVVSGDIKSTVGLQNCANNRHDSHLKLAINPLPDGSAGPNNKSIQGALKSRPSSSCDQFIRHQMHHKKSELASNDATGARAAAAAACWNEGLSVEREELILHKSSEKKLLEQSLGGKDVPGKKIAENSKAAASSTSVRSAHDTQGREGNGSGPIASSQLDPKVEGHAAVMEPKTKQAEGSSQYEQKTMSVMRGGEMVQVSYKVYIPKKPPALARRKLQR